MNVVEVVRGDSPVILGFPHTGTEIPPAIREMLNENGRLLADTDWHLHTLYTGLLPGATTVRATFGRYVIDANRDPAGTSLYPGQNTTGLVPRTDFDGQPIWRDGYAPDEKEVAARRAAFHAPYHAALRAEIARVKAIHGTVIGRATLPSPLRRSKPCAPPPVTRTSSTAASRAAGPHAITAGPGRKTSTLSKWNSRSRPTWPRKRHPSRTTRKKRPKSAFI